MDCLGERPNAITFLNLIVACGSSGDLKRGRILHDRIVSCGFDHQLANLGNAIVHMYGRSGSIAEARRAFLAIPSRLKSVASFNSMLRAYVLAGLQCEAIDLFDQMPNDPAPNAVSFTTAIGACSALGWIEKGAAIHARLAGTGLETDVGLATALVNMYGKRGLFDMATKVFESMTAKTVVTWSALIAAYAQHGHAEEAFDLYRRMMREGSKPNEVTFLSVLSACSTMRWLERGREIHSEIVNLGLDRSLVLMNTVLTMYIKCRSLDEAGEFFAAMASRDLKSWMFIIAANAQQGRPERALALFRSLLEERDPTLQPDEVIFASVLNACSTKKWSDDGRAIHRIIPPRLEATAVIGTALVDFYSNCGDLANAKAAFARIVAKDVAAWNAIIGACIQHRLYEEALEIFYRMNVEGCSLPNHRTFVALLEACTESPSLGAAGRKLYERIVASGYELGLVLGTGIINMFAKLGSLDRARDVFARMPIKDLVSWTAIIAAHTRSGARVEARELYWMMALQGLEPDEVTYISILSSCAHAGMVDEAWSYFVSMSEDFGVEPREEHYVCVIDLLGRAGRLRDAEELVMKTSKLLGAVGWTSVLGACRTHGDLHRANQVVDEAVKLEPENSGAYLLLAHTSYNNH
ncbi:hypothetical protein SELMODRAFT_228785 [Selaginella moellendorffii]|uniref:Pentacotripeptide-repeat region of PRORP domain-containing protein n=2 Tax=Selaginella moellendorffii TaxID=88036 RepID=D8SEY0_SELML|nr:hypothetical protein SELMODRAFT_228785 [Selaginella moellendorffii]